MFSVWGSAFCMNGLSREPFIYDALPIFHHTFRPLDCHQGGGQRQTTLYYFSYVGLRALFRVFRVRNFTYCRYPILCFRCGVTGVLVHTATLVLASSRLNRSRISPACDLYAAVVVRG